MAAPGHQSNPSMREVLLQLQSAQAEVRTQAEDLINKYSVDQLLPALASAAASEESDASCRQLAAVLVRRYLHTKLKEAGFTEQQKQTLLLQIMQLIMEALSPKAELIVRKAAAEAIGEVWRQAASPELIAQTAPFGLVIQWLEAQQAQEEGDDVTLLWLLIDRLADIAGPEVYIHRAQQIVQKINATLQTQKVENVVAAEEAFATLFARAAKWKPEGAEAQQEKKNATAAYCTVCPSLMRFASAHASPELLAPLVSLAEKSPMFFRDQHRLLLQCVRDILVSPKNSDETKQVTLQLAAGAFVRAIKFARKHMDLVEELLLLLADAAGAAPLAPEDAAAWEKQEREEETPEETTQSVALELMAELSSELCEGSAGNEHADSTAAASSSPSTKGGGVLELLMDILSRLMSQQDSRYSCVAFDLLSLLLEDDTCRPLLGRFVGSLTSACISAVNSGQAKLRWGGLKCLGLLLQYDETWTNDIRQQYGQELLVLLSQASSGDQSIRCRRQALLALAAFLSGMAPDEECDPLPGTLALVIPHMNGVLSQAVIAGCSSDDSQTQEFALALASALAKACGTAFIPYYTPFMVALRNLLGGDEAQGASKMQKMLQDHSGRCLLQAAVEFGADLGSAVGSEVFKADAPWLVDRLHRLLLFCDEVPAASSVFSAAMICLGVAAPASGPALLQQMQPLMGIVLQKAQASIEFGVEEQLGPAGGSLNEVAELSEEGGYSQIRVQDKTGKQMIMSINTAAVEERVAALRLLGALASAVGAEAPTEMAESWTCAIIASCSSEFSFVRKTAFEALPSCLDALRSAPQRQGEATTAALEIVANFLSGVQGQVPPAQATLASENMLPAIAQILSAQAKLHREGLLSEECKVKQPQRTALLEKFFAGMGKLLLPFLTREFERLATKEQDDDEWESLSDEEDDEEESSTCYDAVMQCTGGLFKIYGAECVPFFDAHLQMPYGALLAHEQSSYYGKVAALCIFADAINFGGEAAARNYSNVFLPAALLAVCPPPDSASDEDQLLAICAAAYGLGAVAQRDPETFATRLQPAIEALERPLSKPAMRSENGRAAADCAACALVKVLAAFGPQQDVEAASTMLARLLENWFPLQEDPQEMLDAHELLLQMLVQGHPLCRNPSVQQQLRRLSEAFSSKPDLLGDKAKREGLLQAAKERLR